ncbi:DUF4232 domain-containing protein [Streptomyces aurantiacus]|uniref:DUF4232 domain-containing protein n=1 Tax=Streptomyces aurantiacus TaxID=47760 RepID=A0A7G1P436_9ACTN|nr:DUF4232 domain-containing protein [Streptomyces aurantiacus]BCL29762.1 hypothetical protein GCM10017557_46210 [Streptomyces aurantiacus]
MRTLPIAVTALAATLTLTLTACGGDDDGSGGDKKTGGEKKTSSSTACPADKLSQEVVASEAPAAGDTGTVSVTLTNGSGADCTLKGFPTVELNAGTTSWAVAPEKSAEPEKLTVKQDETAGFTITYVRGPAGDAEKGAAATTVKCELPGADGELSFAWKYGEVALKSASKPDASVTPLQRTGD